MGKTKVVFWKRRILVLSFILFSMIGLYFYDPVQTEEAFVLFAPWVLAFAFGLVGVVGVGYLLRWMGFVEFDEDEED